MPRIKRAEGRRWISRLLVGLALVIAVAIVVVVVVNAGSSTPNASGNTTKPSGSATVQRRNLVETDTESGTLSYNSPQTVYNRLSGTITWLPQVGQVIKPGQTLYKVNGEPVLLMDGTTPAYRDLGPSDSDGADIEELNRNLVKLGFNAANVTVDDVWQAATTEGVDLLQESLGETETGTLTLGQIVFLPGDQLVTTVDGTLGSTGGTNASATVDPASPEFVDYSVALRPSAPSAHKAAGHKTAKTKKCPTTSGTSTPSTTSTTSTTPTQSTTGTESGNCKSKKSGKPTAEQQLQALLALLKAETEQLKSNHNGGGNPSGGSGSPSSSGSGSHGSGNSGAGSAGSGNSGSGNTGSGNGGSGNSGSGNSGSGNATAILQTTSTQLVVTVDLAATVQSEAVVGEHVTVEMPNGDLVNGKITAVSPVAQSSSNDNNGNGNSGNGNNGNNGNGNNGNGSSSTIPVTVTLSGHNTGAGLDQAAVSVNFVQQKATNVLSVPVTALLATGGGNYAVQEAAAPHTVIPVTTGLFAAGYVEISGSGIYPGLAVTDSQG